MPDVDRLVAQADKITLVARPVTASESFVCTCTWGLFAHLPARGIASSIISEQSGLATITNPALQFRSVVSDRDDLPSLVEQPEPKRDQNRNRYSPYPL